MKYEFIILELEDYKQYTIIDNEEEKVVCHMYFNGENSNYCKEMGQKITDILNEI